MITKKFEIAKPHIESSLAKGNEKLDIANLLYKSKKYAGAIIDYVGAYEELGQALFIVETISNDEKISEEYLKDFFKPGSHNQKILSSHITRRELLKKHPIDDFEKIKNSEIGEDFRNPYTLDETIKKINERIKIYSKLHKLRQTFDYSHDKEGQIMNNNYSEDELDSLCYLLKSECLTSYYETKLALEAQHLKSHGYTDEIIFSKITSLPSYKKFQELSQDVNLKINRKRRVKGLKFIEAF